MAQDKDQHDGIRVLVCGSHRSEDRGFAFGLLKGFANHFDISAIISGPYPGADQFGKEFAKEEGIPYERLKLQPTDRMELSFFDENRNIPDLVMKNDPMFRKGYECLRDSAATVLLVIPTPDGQLGPTCACLKRMAAMVGIECIDGAEAMKAISERMAAAQQANAAPSQTPALPAAKAFV